METDKNHLKKSLRAVYSGIVSVFVLLSGIVLTGLFAGLSAVSPDFSEKISLEETVEAPEIVAASLVPAEKDFFSAEQFVLPSAEESKESAYIKYGHDLVSRTAEFIGPDSDKPFAGNNLNCQNCHLGAGTKQFAAPFVGLSAKFPQFSERENAERNLSDRINGCMERSLDGQKLPDESEEMRAIESYIKWLSREVKIGQSLEGQGFTKTDLPDRAVDLAGGKVLYDQKCASCHMAEGNGQLKNKEKGYVYPPLWGPDSYNTGAGMHRVITAAQFIKSNMPLGATYDRPLLTDEEAYDLAGYINSMPRPVKKDTGKDYTNLKLKPVSGPYPPFLDNFPLSQHKFGPYPEIIAFYKKEYGIIKTK